MPTPARPARVLLRRLAAGAQLAAATTLFILLAAPPAVAQPGTTAAPGTIEVLNTPGIALHIPADGRVHGDGFAAQVTGYRFANQVGYGPSTVKAAHGQRLLVFGLEGAPLAPQTDSQGDITPAVSALLDVDGAQQPLPAAGNDPAAAGNDSSPTYFLASIPSAATDVALDLSSQGFTQTFSFTAGARQGPQPAVLYRAQSSWEATDPVGQTITMATPDPAENVSDAAIDVILTSANLTWFGPDSPSHNPPSPDQAWLVLDMKSQPHSTAALATGYELDYLSTLGPSQVTLTLPGQPAPVPATIAGKGGPADESQDQSGFFGGVYYWQVPADLTAATVEVTPGTITAEKNWLGSPQTITVPGSATFPLTFGAPYQPSPPPASPPPDAAPATTPAAVTTATAHRSSGGFPLLTLLAIPILLLIGGVAFLGRRRHARTDAHRGPPPEPSEEPAAGPPPGPAEEPAAGSGPWPAGDHIAAPPFQTAPHPTGDSRSDTAAATNGSFPHPAATNGSHRPPLLVPPTAPPEPPAGTVRVDVLGSTSITGWPPGPPPRQSVVEIMAFLVLHPNRRFTAEQLQTGLAIGRPRDLSPDSIRRYMNEPRRAIGDHHVPETRAGEGYWLRHVTSDAAQMADLFERARTQSSPADRARHLADGLALVRGAPFAEVPSGTYGWADTDTDLGPAMGRQIRQAAIELGRLALSGHDRVLADWAVERGLRVWPTDDDLLELQLSAARLDGVPELDVAWAHVNKHLERHDTTPTDRLRAAYHQLREEGLPTEEHAG